MDFKRALQIVAFSALIVSCVGRPGGGGKLAETRIGHMRAQMTGTSMVDDTSAVIGDVNATGAIAIAIFKTSTNDYNIRYGVGFRSPNAGVPTTVTINSGVAGAVGDVVLDFDATSATWVNLTRCRIGKGRLSDPKSYGFYQPSLRTGFLYAFVGMWSNASTIITADGTTTLKDLADSMLAAPGTYYGVIATDTFADGAARGQFANKTSTATPDSYWRRG